MGEKLSYTLLGGLCLILVCSGVASAFLFGSHGGGDVRVLKLAHGLDASHPVHKGMEFMKKRVEELSSGKLSIDIYGGGSLGSEPKCMEQIQNASLDMGKNSSSPMSVFIPQLQALGFPYIYRDSEHFWRVLNSEVGKKILDKMRDKGFVGLCYYDAGARSFYTTKRPVSHPDDLKGMKIRVLNARLEIAIMEMYGAFPTIISMGETYTALSQGVVDGAENNLSTYLTSAHCEVAPYYSCSEHTRIPDILYMSAKVWDSLTQEQRAILKQAAEESSQFQRKLWAEKEAEARKILEGKGVKFMEPDRMEFAERLSKLYKEIEGTEIGELVREIKSVK